MFKGWGRERGGSGGPGHQGPSTKAVGDSGEDRALAYLQHQGLRLVQRNYRLAGGPRQRAGEIDLILRAPDGTLVFVEVRSRRETSHGGAAGSVSAAKQRRIVRAAQHYLMALAVLPPCRFDVVAIDGDQLQWLPGAFDASGR
ncbi:MAG: YraN family protein [Aquabacterium sp.]|nr:YraN family protein [Aquabacterium sp.]